MVLHLRGSLLPLWTARSTAGDTNTRGSDYLGHATTPRTSTQTTRSRCHTIRQQQFLIAATFSCVLAVSLLVSHLAWRDTFYYKLRSHAPVQRRIHAHNHALVQGIAYLQSLLTTTGHHEIVSQWSLSDRKRHLADDNNNNTTTAPLLCVAMATRQRRVPYIQASLASLLEGNAPEWIASITIQILNTQDVPEDNLDLELIRRLKLPFVNIHHHCSSSTSSRVGLGRKGEYFNRDYAILLDQCIAHGAPYVVAVEEDAILCRDFLPKVNDLVLPICKLNTTAFVKLFLSDRWDGFENKDVGMILMYCLSIGVALAFASLRWFFPFLWLWFQPCQQQAESHRLVRATALLSVTLWITLILFLNTVLVGRQNLSMLSDRLLLRQQRVIPLVAPYHQAATVAIAYSLEGAKRARDYIRRAEEKRKMPSAPFIMADVLLAREYLAETNLKAYEVTPVLAQHIGVYSSMEGKNNGDFSSLGQNEGFTDYVF